MNLKKLIKLTNGKLLNNYKKIDVHKICINSKEIEDNDIFIAIKGKKTDGNKYIKDVMDKASVIITTRNIKEQIDIPIIKVKNTNQAIKKIGAYNRDKHKNVKVIAITGSVGKTTTKELLSEILKEKYNITKTKGNMNNNIGVPLTLSKINDKTEVVILELGMNHPKEISYLSKMAKPNISIITNIGTSHIGNLKSKENILKAKLEIIDGMKNGTLIINKEDEYLNKINIHKNIKIIKTEDIENIILKNNLNYETKIYNKKENIIYKIPNIYLINNINLVIKTCEILNIDKNIILNVIKNSLLPKNRLEIIKKDNYTIINDTYNASLESFKSSISLLNQYNNKLIILGDIKELGKYTINFHNELKKIIENNNIEAISVGDYTKNIKKHFNNNHEIIDYLKSQNLENKCILIKGSRKMHLEEITDYLVKYH